MAKRTAPARAMVQQLPPQTALHAEFVAADLASWPNVKKYLPLLEASKLDFLANGAWGFRLTSIQTTEIIEKTSPEL